MSSSKLCRIYKSLPPEIQGDLVQDHLLPLVDHLPKERSKKILRAATRNSNRLKNAPVLDIKAKRAELVDLLDELQRDGKRSFMKERSNFNEILHEIVDSLTNWMGSIWSTAFEYRTNFALVHECLMLISRTLERVTAPRACCKCAYMSLYVPVIFKNKAGRRVKSFHLNGVHALEKVLFWLWREIFVSMLASDLEHHKILAMLRDIESTFGWQALERVIVGGESVFQEEQDDDEWSNSGDDADNEEDYIDEDEDIRVCTTVKCSFHADHWPLDVAHQAFPIRDIVKERLIQVFRDGPSYRLYSSIMTISNNLEATELELVQLLSEVATSGPDSFASALEIHSHRNGASSLVRLLDSHSHLLRPKDASALQAAATCISCNPLFQSKAVQLVEKELLDTSRSIKASLLPSFARIDESVNLAEVSQFVTLPKGSPTRSHRLAAWIDAVSTPVMAPHPVAFAAFIMGLPIGPEEADSEDPLGLMDFDNDPDLADLREESRPSFKHRFESWADTAISMKGGAAVLMKVYLQIIEWMPYLRGNDVVEEMIAKLADRPSKLYLCDALDGLSAFVKVQGRMVHKQKKKDFNARPTGRGGRPEAAAAPKPAFGGMEDVD